MIAIAVSVGIRGVVIGCAVGGSSFELAKYFAHVDAFDYSQSFIDAAIQMQQQGIQPNLISINIVMNAWANQANIDNEAVHRARALLSPLDLKNTPPMPVTLATLVSNTGSVAVPGVDRSSVA